MKKTVVYGLIAAVLLLAAVMLLQNSYEAQLQIFTNTIGMKFVRVHAGSFFMGSCVPADDNFKASPCPAGIKVDPYASFSEGPQHQVRISKPFYMGMYEVTVGQFKQFIADAGRDALLSEEFLHANSHGNRAAVSKVSWRDAQDFVQWLNQLEPGHHYRLPSEAEWEYAARAGSDSMYPWGDDEKQIDAYAWYWNNATHVDESFTHNIGEKKPNVWGLYDMQGNVWEWNQDCWHDDYQNAPANGGAWLTGKCAYRVIRGGSWDDRSDYMRPAARNWIPVGFHRLGLFGFRVVRD